MPLSDDEEKLLKELLAKSKEKTDKPAEDEKDDEGEKKPTKEAIKAKPATKKDDEIAGISEDTAHALIEELKKFNGTMAAKKPAKGKGFWEW